MICMHAVQPMRYPLLLAMRTGAWCWYDLRAHLWKVWLKVEDEGRWMALKVVVSRV